MNAHTDDSALPLNDLGAIDFAAMPTLAHIPAYFSRRHPDKVALDFEGRQTTWQQLDAAASTVAKALQQSGCQHRDRIVVVARNSDYLYELLFGAARAGVCFSPIIFRLAPDEVAAIIADCQPSMIFVDSSHATSAAHYAITSGQDVPVIALEPIEGLRDYTDWCSDPSPRPNPTSSPRLNPTSSPRPPSRGPSSELPTISEDDTLLLLYTSGTTGKPKGVMLSHGNLFRERKSTPDQDMPWHRWLDTDVNLVALPNGHIGGVGWAIVGFYNGATTIIQREFIPDRVLDALANGVTKLFLVPTALQMLLMQPRVREINYSRLRHILYGASPIALDLLRQCTQVFGCGFIQQYGATETSGTVVYLPPEDHDPAGNQRMRGAGLPMPGVQIRVVDPEGKVLGPHAVGEVEVRSPSNMQGYFRNPKATADTVSADGWLKTGDAGYLDEDGYLFIQDRIKDMICSGAENVYPAEVESAIYGHPAIAEVAVIGVPDPKWGEAVKAMVVLRPGQQATAEEIIEFARGRIAGFKVPKSVDFIQALPRNASGKILRRELRAPFWAGYQRGVN